MIQLAKKTQRKNQRSQLEIETRRPRTRSATRNMSTNRKLSISPATSIRLILIVVSINCCTSGAWRLFGSPSASRLGLNEQTIEPTSGRSFSDHYQPFYNNVYGQAATPNNNNNNNNHHYHHYQPSQLLTPSTGASQQAANNLRVSSYLNEQLIGAAPEVAPNQLLAVQQQLPQSAPQPQAAALAAAPTQSPAVESSSSSSAPPPPSTSDNSQQHEAPVKARDASFENNNAKQAEPPTSLQGSPSPLGKIIDSVLSSALNESLSSRSQTTTPSATSAATATTQATSVEQSNATQELQIAGGRLLANVASQMLKPRNKSSASQERKGSVASAEQQIINQHARVHLAGHSHQRLWPTKQRDNKLASEIATDSSSSGSSSSSPSSSSSSFAEPFYSLLLNNFKSGITSRSSIKKAISDNKLARTLSTVTKTMGSNKYVASAGAAAALAALGLTMSKFLTPYLFAGAYSKLGEPMTMSGSSLLNSYVLNNERHYQPMGAGSSPPMFFLNPGQDPMMTSSSSVPRLSQTQQSFLQQINADSNPGNLASFLDQQQQFSVSSPSMSMSPSISKQMDLSPASDINGYYTNFYTKATPEEQPMSTYPSSIKDNIQMANTNTNNLMMNTNSNNNNNNNDQMIMSAASSINSLGYPPSLSSVSFMPHRSGTVSLKMDDSTRNLLHQMISRRQKEQLPQVTNYLEPVGSPANSKQADYSTGWMAPTSNVNTLGDDNPTINGQAGPSVSLYYSTGETSPLIEQQAPQNSRDHQQQINQGGQMSSSSSSPSYSSKQLDESYSSNNNNNNNNMKQWLSPARRQQQEQQHQQRSVGGQSRLDSRGWQSIQQQPSESNSNKQPPAADNATYQAVNLRQNSTANANERDLRDVHWQRRGISRPPKTTTSAKTSASATTTKTAKVYMKQRRPVVNSVGGEFQLNSSSPAAQTIDYGLAPDRPATGEQNRHQQQQAAVLFDLQQPPEATSTQSSDNNRFYQHLNHLRQQQQQLQDDDNDKQNAIKVIEMNGNNRTQQLVDSMEAVILPASSSLSSPGNNEDIISTSPASMSLSLGDVSGDNRPDANHRDHLQSDNQSVESPPSRAFRGPVAGSIVGGLSSGQPTAEMR